MGKRAQFLFEHYRQNLNRLLEADPRIKASPDRDDIVICPLCFNTYYTLEDLENGNLTQEHAPPHKLGGKIGMLTCEDCNNSQGASLDSHLIAYIRSLDVLDGISCSYMRGSANANETGEIKIEWRISETKLEILCVPKASHPKHIENFTKNFLSPGGKLTLKFLMPAQSYSSLALIRTAYLLAFKDLGYGFLMNFNLHNVRRQLQNPHENHYSTKSVLFPLDVPDTFLGINIISNPVQMKCYFIVFDVQADKGLVRRAGVMLPGPNLGDYEMFEDMEAFNGTNMTITHVDVAWDDKISMPRLAHIIWNSA